MKRLYPIGPTVQQEEIYRRYREANPYGADWNSPTIGEILAEVIGLEVIHQKNIHTYLKFYYPPMEGRAAMQAIQEVLPAFDSPYTRWYVVRDLVRILPKRPRCMWCHTPYQQWAEERKLEIREWWFKRGVGGSSHWCSSQCLNKLFRRDERRTRRRKEDRQCLRSAAVHLKLLKKWSVGPNQAAFESLKQALNHHETSGTS